jgi:hypothetical protein
MKRQILRSGTFRADTANCVSFHVLLYSTTKQRHQENPYSWASDVTDPALAHILWNLYQYNIDVILIIAGQSLPRRHLHQYSLSPVERLRWRHFASLSLFTPRTRRSRHATIVPSTQWWSSSSQTWGAGCKHEWNIFINASLKMYILHFNWWSWLHIKILLLQIQIGIAKRATLRVLHCMDQLFCFVFC